MAAHETEPARSSFLGEVIADTPGGERIVHCLQCGSCGGSCPNGADMQYTPRTLFAMINADEREAVLAANTMWCCVSCYFCTTRCPQNIPITDIMYALKRMAIAENMATRHRRPGPGQDVHRLCWRSTAAASSSGWPAGYYLLNRPVAMVKMGPMGMSMFTRGRMALLPDEDQASSTSFRRSSRKPGNWEKRREIRLLSRLFAGMQRGRLRRFDPGGGPSCWASSSLEIDDWNCCGATEYLQPGRIDRLRRGRPKPGPGRSAAWINSSPRAPRAILNLAKTDKLMADNPEMNAKINQALGRRRACTTSRAGCACATCST